MKNLFKNLMLVAVAAMAFTACQNDSNEVNEVAKKTVLDFVATIANQDDTRSGFTGTYTEGEDTYYQSGWDGDETFIVCANGSFDANKTVAIEDAEGHFSVAFDGNVPTFIDVYSPASAWNSQHTPTVPAVQTPRANSVDPAAHILKAEGATVATGMVNMQHKVAYGKMTVNTPADFEISKVELSLVGLPNSSWTDNQTYSYTINANEVEGNVFWFATEAMQIVKEFTVTAYNAEEQAYSKTVTGLTEGKLAFIVGQVSTFSVSNLEAYVEPEEPEVPAFSRAYKSGDNYNDFYLYFEDDVLGVLMLNPAVMANPDWEMILGTYNIGYNNVGKPFFYPGQYSTYKGTYLDSGEVSFSAVDGQYLVEFTDIADENGNVVLERAMYKGTIEGLNTPDSRTKLETPTATATADGNVITISWNEVTGADEYYVSCTTGGLDAITTTDTSVIIEAEYSTKYDFSIKAVASDSNPDYKTSGVYDFSVTTGKDPNAVIPEFTTIKYLRQEVTYASYNEYCHVFELTNSDNYKMELYVHSSQSSSTHIAEGEYHFESKMNLGYNNAQWGFQAKVWSADGSYLGLTSQDSVMVVSKSGDIYNIDFTLIMDGKTHFFVCNAAIGGNEPEPEPEPDPTPDPEPEPDPTPDPDQPGDIVVPDGHILLNTCEYITEISGILRQYRFATNDGNNIFYVFVKKDTTHGVSYIETKTYSNGSMNQTAGSMNMFNMDCNRGSSISDTKIDGAGYANGISTSSSNTMEVKSATENGIHEIVFNVKGKAYYFYGTIQE